MDGKTDVEMLDICLTKEQADNGKRQLRKPLLKAFDTHKTAVIYEGKTEIATEESIFIPTNKYQAWNCGSETVIQGATDNSADGAKPTITQTYVVKRGTTV